MIGKAIFKKISIPPNRKGRRCRSPFQLNRAVASWAGRHLSGVSRQEIKSQAVEGGRDPGRKQAECEQVSSWQGQIEKETLEKYH